VADPVQVSSVVYNLAGPEAGRIDFLKSTVIASMAEGVSIAEGINTAYLNGPAIKFRLFNNWAKRDSEFLDKFGTVSSGLKAITSVNAAVLLNEIYPGAGLVIDRIQEAEVHEGRIHFWVLQYMYQFRPGMPIPQPAEPGVRTVGSGEPVSSYYYDADANLIVITFSPEDIVEVTPAGYDPAAKYLYVKYIPALLEQEIPYPLGEIITLAPEDPSPTFPGDTWVNVELDRSVATAELTAQDTVDRTYSDGRTAERYVYAPVVTAASQPTYYAHWISDTPGDYDELGVYYAVRTHKEFWIDWVVDTREETVTQTITLSGGVVRTDVLTRVTEYLKEVRKVRVSTQPVRSRTVFPSQWYIYKYESGIPALDAEMRDEALPYEGMFYPPIPLRINNHPVAPLRKSAIRWHVNLGRTFADFFDDLPEGAEVSVEIAGSA
jgi:hypothetical protein